MVECKENCLYSRLGMLRVMAIVWHAIPWKLRLFSFPYCFLVYRRFLARSTKASEVKSMHSELFGSSKIYKICRPRFRLIKPALLLLDVKPSDQAVHENATTG